MTPPDDLSTSARALEQMRWQQDEAGKATGTLLESMEAAEAVTVDELRTRLKAAEEENARIKGERDAAFEDLESARENSYENGKAAMSVMQGRAFDQLIREKKAEHEAQIKSIRSERDTLKAEKQAAEEKLARLKAAADADEADLNEMRDGTKLTRHGIIQIIAYQREDIADLKEKLAQVTRERANLSMALKAANVEVDAYLGVCEERDSLRDRCRELTDALAGVVNLTQGEKHVHLKALLHRAKSTAKGAE